MITSKITSKAQTTVPQPVRAALNLKEGDRIGYEIHDGRVVMLKVEPKPEPVIDWDPFATFWEWNSPEMCKAYDDV